MSAGLVITLCCLSAVIGYWIGYRSGQRLEDELVRKTDEIGAELRELVDKEKARARERDRS